MLLSGSRWGLARACLAWARDDMPEVARVESEDASKGTDRHMVMEALRKQVPLDFPRFWGCTPEEWPAIEANIREWLPGGSVAEIAIYYDPTTDTARSDRSADRNYDARPGEIPMTIDAIEDNEGLCVVWDYKNGRQENLEPATTNGQVAICCLGAARNFGASAARGILAIVADDGTVRLDSVDFDSLDLDAIAYEARGLIAAIPTAQPQPGPWCGNKWCPARAQCPATQTAIVATPMAPLSLVINSAEVCARVHTQIALAEEFLNAVKRARNEWLSSNPGGCELADGSILSMGIEERDTIDVTPAALSALEAAGCSDAIEPRTSKAAIERAIKARAAKGTAAAKIREVMEALDAAHAIKTTQYAKPRVRKGRKAA